MVWKTCLKFLPVNTKVLPVVEPLLCRNCDSDSGLWSNRVRATVSATRSTDSGPEEDRYWVVGRRASGEFHRLLSQVAPHTEYSHVTSEVIKTKWLSSTFSYGITLSDIWISRTFLLSDIKWQPYYIVTVTLQSRHYNIFVLDYFVEQCNGCFPLSLCTNIILFLEKNLSRKV